MVRIPGSSAAGVFSAALLMSSVVAAQHGQQEQHPAEGGAHSSHHEKAQESGKVQVHSMHHRFDDAERWSKSFDAPERAAWQKPAEVIALMKLEPGMTVADIGAGTGYFVSRLSPAVGPDGHVLGLDIEPDMVRFMTERAEREGWSNVEARVVEPDSPGLSEGSADRVLIVDTWHHIGDRENYTKKLRAGLADEGAVYVVDFTLESAHGPPVSQRLTAEQVANELRAGGLAPEILEETLPDQYIVVGRRPAS